MKNSILPSILNQDICAIPETMINKTQDCRAPYSITDEEDVDFDEGWKAVNQSGQYSATFHD